MDLVALDAEEVGDPRDDGRAGGAAPGVGRAAGAVETDGLEPGVVERDDAELLGDLALEKVRLGTVGGQGLVAGAGTIGSLDRIGSAAQPL